MWRGRRAEAAERMLGEEDEDERERLHAITIPVIERSPGNFKFEKVLISEFGWHAGSLLW